MRYLFLICLSLPLIFFGTGCAEPGRGPAPIVVNLEAWQQNVEHYIDEEGNGDPNILHDTTLPLSAAAGFALLGAADVKDSTDATGLLLGHKQVQGTPWFVFLVGLSKAGELYDIRLVALSCREGIYQWAVGNRDTEVTARYASAHNHDGPVVFPAPDDHFDLSIDGQLLSITHNNSGAQWHLLARPATGPARAPR